MNKKKKILIIVFAIVSAGLLVLAVFVDKQQKKETPVNVLPSPDIPKGYKGKFGFTFELDDETSLPNKLSVIEVSPALPFSENEARKISSSFGYDFEPNIVQDVYDGDVYIWETENSILYVRSKSKKIDYQTYIDPHSVFNTQLTDKDIETIASKFLADKSLVENENLEVSFFVFYETRPSTQGLFETSKENATFYQVNFSPKFLGKQILTLNPVKTPVNVTILPDGTVYKAEIGDLGKLKESVDVFDTKTLEEVKNQVSSSILVSLNDGNIFLEDLNTTDIQEMTIKSIEIAYFRESPTSKIYQPIYLLKGTAKVKGFANSVNAVLYLPAINN